MSQECLSGLSVIIINNAITGQNDLMDDFASRKARKVRI